MTEYMRYAVAEKENKVCKILKPLNLVKDQRLF